MLNFIICDDNKEVTKNVKRIIDKVMLKNDIHYEKYEYSEYDTSFKKMITKKLANKIYIMDIITGSRSGIDTAREIREVDIDSIIIFMTAHNELGSQLLYDEIMFLTLINKYNNFNVNLEKAINKSIQMVGIHQMLEFKIDGVDYQIPYNDILYITCSECSNKGLIITEYGSFVFNYNLKELAHILKGKVIRTHRKCYVNPEHIKSLKGNDIYFKNGLKIPYLSPNYKKGLLKNV